MRRSWLLLLTVVVSACATTRQPGTPQYAVSAVQFATIPGFAVRGLVAGADTSRRLDIAMMIWPLVAANGDVILVDAGFVNEKFMRRWQPRDHLSPDSALRRAGIAPERVTDIIVSHVHWDHADGIVRFPSARIWLQREEYTFYVTPSGAPRAPAIDSVVAQALRAAERDGRLRLLDGDSAEVRPGIRVHTGGKHTYASQFVSVHTAAGRAVIASDNAYLYENLERQRPIAQTLDSLSNLEAQRRMLRLASHPRLVVPGHDPEVFRRFSPVERGAVVIR